MSVPSDRSSATAGLPVLARAAALPACVFVLTAPFAIYESSTSAMPFFETLSRTLRLGRWRYFKGCTQ